MTLLQQHITFAVVRQYTHYPMNLALFTRFTLFGSADYFVFVVYNCNFGHIKIFVTPISIISESGTATREEWNPDYRYRVSVKVKRPQNSRAFLSVINSWCTIGDVKITPPDDTKGDIKEIRELQDDKTGADELSL